MPHCPDDQASLSSELTSITAHKYGHREQVANLIQIVVGWGIKSNYHEFLRTNLIGSRTLQASGLPCSWAGTKVEH